MKKGKKWALGIFIVIVIMILAILFVTPEILGFSDKSVYELIDSLTFGKFWTSRYASSMADYADMLKLYSVRDLGIERLNFFGIISFVKNFSNSDVPGYMEGDQIQDFDKEDVFSNSQMGSGGMLIFPQIKEIEVSGSQIGGFLQELIAKDDMPISVEGFQIETVSPGKVFVSFTGFLQIPDEEFLILSSVIPSVKQDLPFKAEFFANITNGSLEFAKGEKNTILIDNLTKEQSTVLGTLGFKLLELDKALDVSAGNLEDAIFNFLIEGINKMGHSMTANGRTIKMTTNKI